MAKYIQTFRTILFITLDEINQIKNDTKASLPNCLNEWY